MTSATDENSAAEIASNDDIISQDSKIEDPPKIITSLIKNSDSEDRKSDENINPKTFEKDVAAAAVELQNILQRNAGKLETIDQIGVNLEMYTRKEYRTNEKWTKNVLLSMLNDRAWIKKHIIRKSKAMHFNVYAYIVQTYFNGKECNADTCASMKNIVRDRMSEKDIGPGSIIDTMDAIHVSLLHGYDTGEKLYTSERLKMEEMVDKINAQDCTDLEVNLMRSLIYTRFARHLQRLNQNHRNNKFVTELATGNNCKNDNAIFHENEKKIESDNNLFAESNKHEMYDDEIENIEEIENQSSIFDNKVAVNDENTAMIENHNRRSVSHSASVSESYISDHSSESNISTTKNATAKNDIYSLYRFGYKFYYHQKFKNNTNIDRYYNGGIFVFMYWYILQKYTSVQEEILNKLTKRAYEQEMKSAEMQINTQYHRESTSTDEQCKDYHTIDRYSALQISHLLCLLIYCNFGSFCTMFSATFRKKSDSETNEALKLKNSEFREFSRLLVEIVHCFGTIMENSKLTVFFHGINCIMQFPSTHGQFCSPTSTTTDLTVAISFGGSGIVLELANCRSARMSFFDCEMISVFSNEAEKLFIQGGFHSGSSQSAYSAMAFKSVRNMVKQRNYEHFVIAISCFQQMIKGEDAKNNTLELKDTHVRSFQRLIKANMEDSLGIYDSYIVQMFKILIEKTTSIYVWTNFMNVRKYGNKNYYFLKMRGIFCELYSKEEIHQNRYCWGRGWKREKDGHEKHFIQPIFAFKFDFLFKLFPNLINIDIFHLPLTHLLMKYILNLNVWTKKRGSNIRISIKEEREKYSNQSKFIDYKDCIEQYSSMFQRKGLSIRNIYVENCSSEENDDDCDDQGIEISLRGK